MLLNEIKYLKTLSTVAGTKEVLDKHVLSGRVSKEKSKRRASVTPGHSTVVLEEYNLSSLFSS